jgi:hypothetical protein
MSSNPQFTTVFFRSISDHIWLFKSMANTAIVAYSMEVSCYLAHSLECLGIGLFVVIDVFIGVTWNWPIYW